MSQSLIFSRKSDNGVLSYSDIARRAPSALTEYGHAEGLSSRYGEMSTLQALEVLSDYGWQPVQALQKKPRVKGNVIYSAHMLAFSNPNMPVIEGEGRPEVILYNSHDGTSALKVFAGFYRFICSNGIIAGSGFAGNVRHTKNNALGFETMLVDTLDRVPALMGLIDRLKGIQLDREQSRILAHRAASLRWDDLLAGDLHSPVKAGVYFDTHTTNTILDPIRSSDTLPDAWTVFNRIQESVTRGKTVVASITKQGNDLRFKYRNARALGAVSELVRVNRGLWDIAREVAEV
jgi:hypothetical protein